jgi:hypothetical protein
MAVQWFEPTPTGYRWGAFHARQDVDAVSDDAEATPSAQFVAEGFIVEEVQTPCCTTTFDGILPQIVSPTAMSMDPLGNSATFTGMLTGTQGSYAFDLSLTGPTAMGYGPWCQLPCVNAYFDPSTETAGARHLQGVGLSRSGYTVTGVFAGYLISGDSMVWADTFTQVGATQSVVAP